MNANTQVKTYQPILESLNHSNSIPPHQIELYYDPEPELEQKITVNYEKKSFMDIITFNLGVTGTSIIALILTDDPFFLFGIGFNGVLWLMELNHYFSHNKVKKEVSHG